MSFDTFEFNRDEKRRNDILGIGGNGYGGGIIHYKGLDVDRLEKLIKEGFANPEDQQNCAPSIGEILKFLKANPNFTCFGYAVCLEREDYRVSIEGVESMREPSIEERENFTNMFRMADDFTCNGSGCYAWYD